MRATIVAIASLIAICQSADTIAPTQAPSETNMTAAPTMSPSNWTNTSAPTISPSSNTTAPTAAPTSNTTEPTTSPTPSPSQSNTTEPPTSSPTDNPTDTTSTPTSSPSTSPTIDVPPAHHKASIGKIIAKTFGWLILIALSVLIFGAAMSNRYQIYYALRGIWYTILQMECTRWIITKLNIGGRGGGTNTSLNEIIFDNNDLTEGLLMGDT